MATRSKRKVKPSTSIKQILTRNYNWKIGNLRRLYVNALALDPEYCREVQEIITEQIGREEIKHKARLAFLETNNIDTGGYDEVFIDAKYEAERNKRAKSI